MEIKIINGPNLNMLGKRESNHYGTFTLADLEKELTSRYGKQADLDFFQSNSESDLIHYIHENGPHADGIVINAGAFTHTSIALRDALLAAGTPFVEVHISNVFAREEFRHVSYLSDKAAGVILGLGKMSYFFAVEYFLESSGQITKEGI